MIVTKGEPKPKRAKVSALQVPPPPEPFPQLALAPLSLTAFPRPVAYLDFELRSRINLVKAGAHRYAADPSTEVLCAAYTIDAGEVQIWHAGDDDSAIRHAITSAGCVVAHGAIFERAIIADVMVPRFGWPSPRPEQWRCTQTMAQAAAFPALLEMAAKALLLPGKDAEGEKLMHAMTKPRRPREDEDPAGIYWNDSAEARHRLGQYCMRDIEVERVICHALPPLTESELALWHLSEVINQRGLPVDIALATAARALVWQEQKAINAELAELTGGEVTSINQVKKIAELLRQRGHAVEKLGKRNVAALLAHGPAADIKRILELRQSGAKASAAKLESLFAGVDPDHRLRGCYRFHAASTGRWGGMRFQPQNLTRAPPPSGAIEAVLSGDLARVRAFGPPLAIIGGLNKAMVCAPPERELLGADFASIESRILSWLAGETWKLDLYRKFDATEDPALEPYCVVASQMFGRPVTPDNKEERQLGKYGELSCGFGGALGAWRRIAPDDKRDDAAIQRNIADWRNAHPNVVRYWRRLEGAAHRCLRTGLPQTLGTVAFSMQAGALLMTLPSGRAIRYPEAKLVAGKFEGMMEIAFKDNAKGRWSEGRAWSGTLVENLVQGVARCLLGEALQRLAAAGFAIVVHTHDEVVAEVPQGCGDLNEFAQLLLTLPTWAENLPLAAKAWRRQRLAEVSDALGDHAVAPLDEAEPGIEDEPDISEDEPEDESQTSDAVLDVLDEMPPVTPEPPPWEGEAEPACEIPATPTITTPIAAPSVKSITADALFDDLVDAANRPSGGKIACPFHADTSPSMHVYPDGHVYCYSCKFRGDHVEIPMMLAGLTRDQATAALANRSGKVVAIRPRLTPAPIDPERTLRAAAGIWQAGKPIAGTLAIRYLAEIRGINVDALPDDVNATLRFHPHCPFDGRTVPALVALFRDVVSNEPAGIHRIALPPEVFAGAKVERKSLGCWPSPRAIKLWPATDRLFLGEGIETVLAAATVFNMRPAWAAGNTSNIAKFPVLRRVKLVLLVDNDQAGRKAANACRHRFQAAGRELRRLLPRQPGADFNDLILERQRQGVPT
jgi:DNA polymerase